MNEDWQSRLMTLGLPLKSEFKLVILGKRKLLLRFLAEMPDIAEGNLLDHTVMHFEDAAAKHT